MLAWSSTVHRVQGLSLDKCVLDLGKKIFCAAMAYVGLSRVRSFKGLYLTDITRKSLMACSDVITEMARLRKTMSANNVIK